MFDEEAGLLVKWLEKEDVDFVIDGDDENEVCRVAEMFDEDVGPLVSLLDKKDVDLFVDVDVEDEV